MSARKEIQLFAFILCLWCVYVLLALASNYCNLFQYVFNYIPNIMDKSCCHYAVNIAILLLTAINMTVICISSFIFTVIVQANFIL